MMDNYDEELALVEALTLERRFIEPISPSFTGYGPEPRWWNWYGGPWPVSASSHKNHVLDIEYVNNKGERHRLSGPAYISKMFNVRAWYKEGKRHRVGGPAYIHNCNFVWFHEDVLHNFEGPAVVEGGGPVQFWIHGVRMSAKEYKKQIASKKRRGLIK